MRPHHVTTIADRAEGYGISEDCFVKVVYQPGVAGYIETVRGRNGGVRLLKEPREINACEIVRPTEPGLDLVTCFDTSDFRVLNPPAFSRTRSVAARSLRLFGRGVNLQSC
jgi:Rrf2 family transcriptional regulator, nitric oxide-sensitive transcriptional repressor